MQDLKFEVYSPKHSELIQEKLFEMGFEWESGATYVMHTDEKHLFLEAGSLSYGTDPSWFNHHKARLTTYNELCDGTIATLDGKTAVIDGREYTLTLKD